MVYQQQIMIKTSKRGMIDITNSISDIIRQAHITMGICHIFILHTSASVVICENADPSVQADLETIISRLAPDGASYYTHDAEGPDDMTAHARTVLTQTQLSIPVSNSKLCLGTWQGVFLWEHRTQSHNRKLMITVMGE